MAINGIMDGLSGYVPHLLTVLVVIAFCWRMRPLPTDPREPPLISPTIPIVGHVIGMFRHKMKYFEIISAKTSLPICSIPLVTSKIHIIMSPDIVQSALRNRALSFDSFIMAFAKRVLGAKSEKFAATSYTPKNDKEECFNNEMHKVYHEPMQPGPALQETNGVMLQQIANFMNKIGTDYEQKDLYYWLRDSFTVATSIALFGSRNAFPSDPTLINSLWDFEAGVQLLLLDFFPSLICPSAYRGRAAVQAAGRRYYALGHDTASDISTFIRRRIAVHRKYGFTNDEMGDYDIGMMLVATTNAIPTLFWNVVYVLSDESLVSKIREEVMSVISESKDEEGTGAGKMVIGTAKFVEGCPLLYAAYQESMRLSNKSMSIRVAEEDTTVTSAERTYLIKKGSVVLLPSSLHHTSPEIWGGNAAVFEPGRWLKDSTSSSAIPSVPGQKLPSSAAEEKDGKESKEAERLQKKAFFPFGGGRHLCPGRHFAFAEILGMIALLVVGYEVVMADDTSAGPTPGGPLRVPEREYRFFGEAIPKPVGKYDVFIRRRKGFENVTWAFST